MKEKVRHVTSSSSQKLVFKVMTRPNKTKAMEKWEDSFAREKNNTAKRQHSAQVILYCHCMSLYDRMCSQPQNCD